MIAISVPNALICIIFYLFQCNSIQRLFFIKRHINFPGQGYSVLCHLMLSSLYKHILMQLRHNVFDASSGSSSLNSDYFKT
ncbi:hypothetical protein BKX93_02920 [Chromobacterium vaccinii]|uniref:Uncharacterized protein n=1 Tax=Chromobacterium vaccinii TaxID=1108595 RepID=A0A1D9LCR6_9NEIS|nr:hypothetical protein BKX93_02920 [Chromobacterium vaccinii]